MRGKSPDETVERTYAPARVRALLCLSVAREGSSPFMVLLPSPGALTVGRDPEADLAIASPSLSRVHFAIEAHADDAVTIRDAGSRNGTLVDGLRIGDIPRPLALGAQIIAGDLRCTVMRRDSLPATTRPLVTLGAFEAALSLGHDGRGVVAGIALGAPFYSDGAVLEALGRLPAEAIACSAGDQVLLLRAPAAAVTEWLASDLRQRGATVEREVSLPAAGATITALLSQLRSAPAVADRAAAEEPPRQFRYPSLRKVHDALRRVAPRPLSILITGETGTGKELLAREIHRLSERRGPLVAINTATLPETLIESELFGYERGAFTGAQAPRAGLIETADQGTLFLDEIGELPLALQSKLLRVLEERAVRRVGATVERPVDLRVVAATHHDLHALVAEKRFRQDLLFRIEGAEVHLPSLRERAAEIAELAHALVAEIEPGRPPAIDPAALRVLEQHAWPGNVRELKHVLERALAFAGGEPLAVEHLPPSLGKVAARAPSMPPAAADVRASVRDFERERITEALHKAGGNRTKAAQILGLPRRTLVYKLSKMRIPEE